MSGPAPVHADRAAVQPWLQWSIVASTAVTAAVAGQMEVARRSGTPLLGESAGAAVAVLALVGLRSRSLAGLARALVGASALLVIRSGQLSRGLVDGQQSLLVWVVAAVATFVLADRVATDALPGPGAPAPAAAGRPTGGRTFRAALGAVLVVVVGVVVLLPLLLPRFQARASTGDAPRLGGDDTATGTALNATDRLDMTTRPDLTDAVVFTVNSDRRTFWRGETFDVWDGTSWSRSDDRLGLVAADGTVATAADDVGASGDDVVTQRFRLEADRAEVVFAAASAVEVDAPQRLVQRGDGTLLAGERFMGPGTTYTVRSRRVPVDEAILRAADGPIPAEIAARYASPPVATDRVLAAADEATAGATGTYDKILAIERWMGERTEYSLDAPLSPRGVDVVDHFLFEARQGWCEQIASSLVVLARAEGIPARLVTGYVPGERDPITGTYVVRERDAHAWAEVWFPTVGWVPFDPTADVPLAGQDATSDTPGRWILDHLLVLVLGAAALGVAGWGIWRLTRRAVERRAAAPVGWAVLDRHLDLIGARVGRLRAPDETASAYASALADRYRDPDLRGVGALLDDLLYDPGGGRAEGREAAEAVLARLLAADPPPVDPADPIDRAPEPATTGPPGPSGPPGGAG